MNRLSWLSLICLPLCFLLSGCPSGSEGINTITPNIAQGRWPEPLTAQNEQIGPPINKVFVIDELNFGSSEYVSNISSLN